MNPHRPAVGDIYTGPYERLWQILYIDDQTVLLRGDEPTRHGSNTHRIERRVAFDTEVEAEKFKYEPDIDLDLSGETERDWTNVAHIGKKTDENLHKAGYSTGLDVQQASDTELLEIDGLGQAGLENINRHIT